MSPRTLCLLPLACVLAAPLSAQSASSATYFLASTEIGPGASAQTVQYVLDASLASGASTDRAASATYAFFGGFVGTLGIAATGQPWLSAAMPRFATMRSNTAMTLHGTELNLGMNPTLTIGGQAATVGTRTNAAITTTLPPQPAPGWQPVAVSTAFGTTTLPHGIGVLPMIEAVDPIGVGRWGQLVYRGRPGDFMVWGLSASRSPIPIPIAGLGHGLQLDFATLLTTGTSIVTSMDGTLVLDLPPFPAANPFYMQAASLSQDPGYSPGAFTNALRIF